MSSIYTINGKRFKIGDTLTNCFYIERLLENYIDLFDNHFSVNSQFIATINTGNSRPIYKRSTLSNHENHLLRSKINELLDSNHIEYSNSVWSSPVSMKTIDDKLEICVDYNDLNALTLNSNDQTSLPNVQNLIDSIDESKFFSKIVLKDGLHQIALDDSSKRKTAFETDFGHFQWKTYHNGMKNAQLDLQLLTSSLQDFVGEFNVKVYLGHILIHSKNYWNHYKKLENIFWHLRNFNLKIDIEQSSFFMNEILYLGHLLNDEGIWITQDKLYKIMDFEEPIDKTGVRKFLGLLDQYRSYISDFDQISQPLTSITNPNVPFRWNHLQRDSFNILKDMISNVCPLIGFD